MGRCPVKPHKLDSIGSTPISASKGLCLVDLYTNYLTVVLDMDYSSTTTASNNQLPRFCLPAYLWHSIGYDVCGLWQEDHLNLN